MTAVVRPRLPGPAQGKESPARMASLQLARAWRAQWQSLSVKTVYGSGKKILRSSPQRSLRRCRLSSFVSCCRLPGHWQHHCLSAFDSRSKCLVPQRLRDCRSQAADRYRWPRKGRIRQEWRNRRQDGSPGSVVWQPVSPGASCDTALACRLPVSGNHV